MHRHLFYLPLFLLTPFFATHTSCPSVSPVFATLTKNYPGVTQIILYPERSCEGPKRNAPLISFTHSHFRSGAQNFYSKRNSHELSIH
jgi:hypothetical protein